MMFSSVRKYIKEGNYSEALYHSKHLQKPWSLIFASRIQELTGHFEDSLDLATRALDSANSPEEKVAASVSSAYVYWRLFEFEKGHQALNQVEEELKMSKLQLSPWRGTFHNIRGLLLWKNNLLETAMKSFESALIIRKEIGDQYAISYTLNNIGNTHLKFHDYSTAERYYTEAYTLRQLLQYKPALAASENSFGRLLDEQFKYIKALGHHQKCLELWLEVNNKQFIAKAYRFLAINAHYRGKFEERTDYFNRSDTIFHELSNTTDLKTNADLKRKMT